MGVRFPRDRPARRYSDLDLAIDAGRPLTLDEIARLTEAFRDSDLPYRVDVVDWQGIGDHFRAAIAGERTALDERVRAAPPFVEGQANPKLR